jgi:hypothetical protein
MPRSNRGIVAWREGSVVNFMHRTKNGEIKRRQGLLFLRLPVALHASPGYIPFKAADEKIALSVVQVNNKPQYLVFC